MKNLEIIAKTTITTTGHQAHLKGSKETLKSLLEAVPQEEIKNLCRGLVQPLKAGLEKEEAQRRCNILQSRFKTVSTAVKAAHPDFVPSGQKMTISNRGIIKFQAVKKAGFFDQVEKLLVKGVDSGEITENQKTRALAYLVASDDKEAITTTKGGITKTA